ncbi:MAG: tripartite tricarboxylate transporter substrate binding protein [Proteobacteria bacterium]|nr:tripartite tricarboxylate transporter substrate binding protein [Pseudomonadota bacterium]MBI3499618.1 tripartite tricarboxylate transporter substrate binding protein [Pseudomonadota bacterium]
MLSRHRRLLGLTLIAVSALGAAVAMAQEKAWRPMRAVELVVPSAPGGGLDITARTLQRLFQEEKVADQPVTVVNKPGGSGTIGIAYINQHKGDGHFICVQSPPLMTNEIIGSSQLGLKDVTPVALLVTEEIIFSVAADSPIKTGRDLVDALRKDPDSIAIAVSSSPGGHSHAAAALVMKAVGGDPKKLKMVFFASGGEAATAVMGGHVAVAVTPASAILGHRQAGRIRVIGIPSEARLPGALADVPTWKEQGVDVVFYAWRTLVGPKGMTQVELDWWDNALAKLTRSPQWQEDVRRNLWTANYRNSKDVGAFFAAEHARLAQVLGELGLAK